MKKIVLGMAMLMAAGSTFAANSHSKGAMALGFTAFGSDMIMGKYMMSSKVGLTGGLVFGSHGGDATGTDTTIAVGARNYMGRGDFSPFIGGHFLTYSYNNGDNTGIEFAAEAGAEYFLAKQFSIEGAATFGYSSDDTKVLGTTVTDTRFGTGSLGVTFNYYF